MMGLHIMKYLSIKIMLWIMIAQKQSGCTLAATSKYNFTLKRVPQATKANTNCRNI